MITNTRKVLSALLLGAFFVVLSNPAAMAAKSTTFDISAQVEAEIAITKTAELNFGRFVPDAAGGAQTITLNPVDGVRTKSAASAVLVGGNGIPARFTMTGAANAFYHVTINTNYAGDTIVSGGNNMAVDTWTIYSEGIADLAPVNPNNLSFAKINAGSTDVLTVGGTIHFAQNQAAGTYVLAVVPIAVEYE